jgi:hypothetical protein
MVSHTLNNKSSPVVVPCKLLKISQFFHHLKRSRYASNDR